MSRSVIIGGARTPIGKLGGSLAALSAAELGGTAIRVALDRSGLQPELVEKVIMGMVIQAGAGQIPSRQAARKAGLSWEVQSETINKVCASGMRSVTLADQIIRAGDADVLVAGGMESMSNVPYALPAARWGGRLGHTQALDLLLQDGLVCSFDGVHMGVHGSQVAKEFGISRSTQDEWALRSHQRVAAAQDEGRLAEEIVPVNVLAKEGTVTVSLDESPRRDTSLQKLSRLSPAFEAEGTITAGNAPGINDGAAALTVVSERKSRELGLRPWARILGHAEVGMEARYLAATPGYAIQALVQKTGINLQDVDLFEVNEAFAAVPLVSAKIAGFDLNRTNVNGGAVALGHPIGASGARILLTLIMELRRRGGGLGIAAICSGAAQGDAVLLEVEPA